MMVTALGSVTGPVARAGMYTYLPAYPLHIAFAPGKRLGWSRLLTQ